MNEVELERMVVSGLRRSCDRVRKWFQLIIEWRRFDDLAFCFEFIENFLAQLHFLILILLLGRSIGVLLLSGRITAYQTQCHGAND
jgi:hypothetical protein